MRVCLFGLGAIGRATGRALLDDDGVRIVAAIDTDRRKIGRDLRSVLRLRGSLGVTVSADAASVLRESRPDVVIHATGSRLAEIAPQLEAIMAADAPCVSSCEEMVFAEATDPIIARRLDRMAREHRVALLGTGVNPGFVMDALVIALSGSTHDVTHVAIERILDPLTRRRAFRKKVGLGMTYAEASRLVAAGRLGHVGLRQSALLVARGLGFEIDRVDEDLRILCENETPTPHSHKPSSTDAEVRGLQQSLVALSGKKERIRMDMVMASGVEAPHDAITITGDPDIGLWIPGGIPGDQATVARLLNGMKHVVHPPRNGLLTPLDVPLCPPRGEPARQLTRRT